MNLFAVSFVLFCVVGYSQQNEIGNGARFISRGGLACGGVSRSKNIDISNPRQPPKECIYRIQPSSFFVCQLRIDFDIAMQPPTLPPPPPATGPAPPTAITVPTCEKDEFTVGNFRFCGVSRNQHIYIPFNITRANFRDTLELRFKVADRFSDSSLGFISWNLRVQQLDCPNGAPRSMPSFRNEVSAIELEPVNPFVARTLFRDAWNLAPVGCLQYYPQSQGVIESFNYNSGRGPYLPNLDYAICFRKRESDTKLVLTFENFQMGSILAATPGYDLNCVAQQAAASSEDHLLVPNAVTSGNDRVTRICGNTISTSVVVSSQPGPFAIQFHSDNQYTAGVETGFRIKYKLE